MSPHQPIKLSDLDKSCIKHGGLLNKYFCKKNSNIPNDLAEIVNFHFSHYKSMGTISCHSNQSSYPTGIKKKHNLCLVLTYFIAFFGKGVGLQVLSTLVTARPLTNVEANVLSLYAKSRLHPLYGF